MDKKEALVEAIQIFFPEAEKVFDNLSKRVKKYITIETFIDIISKEEYNLAHCLHISASTISRLMKELFPERSSGIKPCTYLLSLAELKFCAKCKQVKEFSDFRKNSSKSCGYNTYCKVCHLETTAGTQTARQSSYRARKLNQSPPWTDLEKIKEFYSNCPEGYHVDHIIPLKGELVSGLHVLENLQYLPAADNCSKGNKFSI